ncbi:MAG TPA: hypothetical protein VFX49_23265 [Chloroflexota bacterium]|nr:hypothetical protein [Chloroflexota bacterium]
MRRRGPGSSDDPLRRLVLERTHRLLELDTILRARGEPGVLQRSEEELRRLEDQELGPAGTPTPIAISAPSTPPAPDALTDVERRAWVRRHLIVLPGGAP